MARIAVGKCTKCGDDLRVKAEAVKPVMHLTCRCGTPNTVHSSASALEESRNAAAQPENEISRLIKRLDSKDPTIANPDSDPALRLLQFGSDAVPHLVAVLKGERKGNRWIAAAILGRISDDASVTALVEVLSNDKEDGDVRAATAEAIGKSRADSRMTVPVLIEALDDPRFDVRRSVVMALGQIGEGARIAVPRLLQIVDSSDQRVASAVAGALFKIDPASRALNHEKLEKTRKRDALDGGIRELRDCDPAVRIRASREMCELPDFRDFYFRAVEPLVEALNDNESEVRANAAYTLAKIRDKRATEALIQSLKDPDPGIKDAGGTVRQYAATALGEIGDNRATQPLIEAIQSEENWSARIYMIEALGKIGDPRAISYLKSIIETDSDPKIKSEAMEQIEMIEKKQQRTNHLPLTSGNAGKRSWFHRLFGGST